MGRYIAPPKFTQAQSSDTPINGKLRSIVQKHTFEANINGADLAAQALAANPKAVLVDTGVYLDVYPGSLAKGETTSTPDLVAYNFGTGQPFITTNGDLGPVRYGNPFPSTWPLFDGYQWLAVTQYTAPGATNSTGIPTDAAGNIRSCQHPQVRSSHWLAQCTARPLITRISLPIERALALHQP